MSESGRLRILIADDEESFLRVLTAVLESTGRFSVYPCESGDEAVEALKRSRYDVAIIDYKMPGMTGLNILQWLHEQKLDMPVIMLTAAGSENIAVEAMKLGAYDYIRKEHFDRSHFPIIVSGVFERYLFKKEKELRLVEERGLQRDLATLQLLQESLVSITRIAGTTLDVLRRINNEAEQNLLPQLSEAGRESCRTMHEKIRSEIEILGSVNTSLIDLSKVFVDHFTGRKRLGEINPPALAPTVIEKSTHSA